MRWVSFSEFRSHPDLAVATIVEYQLGMEPQVALVRPAAMRSLLATDEEIARSAFPEALDALGRAERLQDDRGARVFLSTVAGRRAICLAALDRAVDAEREASRALSLWPEEQDAGHVLPLLLARRGRYDAAEVLLDSLLARRPDDAEAAMLREQVRAARTPPAPR